MRLDGSLEGVRAFNYAQPCPTETAVHAEINTAGLADGTHALTVEVEDAAGTVATVYSGTLTTANHPVSPILVTPAVDRGALNGNPASESAILAVATKQPRTFTRAQARSAVTLTGRLTDPAGAPIAGALLQLTQQVVGSTTPSAVASTTTNSTGAWTLKVPKGPSRLLQSRLLLTSSRHRARGIPRFSRARQGRGIAHRASARARRGTVCLHRPLGRWLHPVGRGVGPDGDSLRRALAHDRSATNQQQGAMDLPVRVHPPAGRLTVSRRTVPTAPTRSSAAKATKSRSGFARCRPSFAAAMIAPADAPTIAIRLAAWPCC